MESKQNYKINFSAFLFLSVKTRIIYFTFRNAFPRKKAKCQIINTDQFQKMSDGIKI